MSWLRGLRARWRLLVRPAAAESRMDEEFRFHLEREIEKNLRAGMAPEEARRRALLDFGGEERHREAMRDGRVARWLDDLRRDVRVAVRALLANPGFATVTLATIAFGVGATTAMFSAVDAALLRPLPFPEPERLLEIVEGSHLPFAESTQPKTRPDITDLRELDVFAHVAAYAPGGANLSGLGPPRRIRLGVVTSDFFSAIGVLPVIGRAFTAAEGEPNGPPVAILSEDLWRTGFGAVRDLTGLTIKLNGKPYAIVGVMLRGFAFPSEAEVWVPLTVPTTYATFDYFRQYIPSAALARLAPSVTPAQAEARMAALSATYGRAEDASDPTVHVRPFRSSLVGNRSRTLLVLFGATALVLLVACANVASLLISRAVARRREIALRTTLGATSARVLRQLLTESTLLALVGSALGVVLAVAGVHVLEALIPTRLAGVAPMRIDARVLGFTLGVAVLTGVGFGIWPSLDARHAEPNDVLKAGSLAVGASGESTRLRRAFVVAEVALALMLLIGSMLMLRSLAALLSTDSGVQPEQVATLELSLASADYASPETRRAFYERVLERLRARPEVDAAAAINELPLRGGGGIILLVYPEGRRPDGGDAVRYAAHDLRITPDYFRVMGIRVLRGRAPKPRADTLAIAEVAINRTLADVHWPGESPIGQRLERPSGQLFEVVGLVADVRQASIEDEFYGQAYYSLLDTPYDNAALVARGRVPAAVLTRVLQEAVREVEPTQAVYNVRTMEQVITHTIAPRRTNTALITIFGLIAVILAAVGVYGVMAFNVARRTREIGIRMALGARPSRLMASVVREGIALATAGTVLGLIGAWLLSRVLSSLIYGVTTRDPVTFISAPILLLLVAALAALAPALRATRVDPVSAIRVE